MTSCNPNRWSWKGITGLRKVGTVAEEHNLRVIPHHGGGDIGTIATLHLVASWPHAPYWEILHDPPIGSYENRFAIFQDPPRVGSDGLIDAPAVPRVRRDHKGRLDICGLKHDNFVRSKPDVMRSLNLQPLRELSSAAGRLRH